MNADSTSLKAKPIAILALLQLVMIGYGVLSTAALCKLSRVSLESGGYPPPSGYYWAMTFRDSGMLLVILVLVWTILMCVRSSSLQGIPWRDLIGSGIGLVLLLFLTGTFFMFAALTPFMRVLH